MKYFIEDQKTNLWFTVQSAYKGNYWTSDPELAKGFYLRSSAWRYVEKGFKYNQDEPLKGKDLDVTEHELVDNPPEKRRCIVCEVETNNEVWCDMHTPLV